MCARCKSVPLGGMPEGRAGAPFVPGFVPRGLLAARSRDPPRHGPESPPEAPRPRPPRPCRERPPRPPYPLAPHCPPGAVSPCLDCQLTIRADTPRYRGPRHWGPCRGPGGPLGGRYRGPETLAPAGDAGGPGNHSPGVLVPGLGMPYRIPCTPRTPWSILARARGSDRGPRAALITPQ